MLNIDANQMETDNLLSTVTNEYSSGSTLFRPDKHVLNVQNAFPPQRREITQPRNLFGKFSITVHTLSVTCPF